MAPATLFTFSLCLLVYTVFSKPVEHDSDTEQSSSSARELIERTPDILTETILDSDVNSARDNKLVQSLDNLLLSDAVPARSLTNSVESLRRVKRKVIMGRGCPVGMLRYMNKCMLFKE